MSRILAIIRSELEVLWELLLDYFKVRQAITLIHATDEASTSTWLDQNTQFAQRFYERHFYEHPVNPRLWSVEALQDAARAEGVPVPSRRQAAAALGQLCERPHAEKRGEDVVPLPREGS